MKSKLSRLRELSETRSERNKVFARDVGSLQGKIMLTRNRMKTFKKHSAEQEDLEDAKIRKKVQDEKVAKLFRNSSPASKHVKKIPRLESSILAI